MTTRANVNGQARKSLAEQIDRLDAVLDGLAEGINDTVVAAVRAAVGEAVRAVLAETLASPELLARLRAPTPQPTAAPAVRGGLWAAALGRLNAWAAAARVRCGLLLARGLDDARRAASAAGRRFAALVPFRGPLLAAATAGALAGAAAHLGGPWAAAAVAALGGLVGPLTRLAGRALPRLTPAWAPRFGLPAE